MTVIPDKLIQTEGMTLLSEIYDCTVLLIRMNYHIIWKECTLHIYEEENEIDYSQFSYLCVYTFGNTGWNPFLKNMVMLSSQQLKFRLNDNLTDS
jgi:hypothetical protein